MTAFRLAAATVLLAFYGCLAVMAFHPDVSREYRAHYLARTVDCWLDPEAARKPAARPAYELAELPKDEICRFLRFGWWELKPNGATTKPGLAILRLPWREAGQVALTLRGPANSEGATRTAVGGDGTAEPVVLLPGQTATVTVALAPKPAGDAWLLRLTSDYVVSLQTGRGGRVDLVRIDYLPPC